MKLKLDTQNTKQSLMRLSQCIAVVDKAMLQLQDGRLEESKLCLLKAAWYTFYVNSVWMIDVYRANNVDHESNFSVPFYLIAFVCRLITETVSDIKYVLEDANDVEVQRFIGEKDFILDQKYAPFEIFSEKYQAPFRFDMTTTKRIHNKFLGDGLASYNSLCWNTHFNYVGYCVAKNIKNDDGLYEYCLIYIFIALNYYYGLLHSNGYISKDQFVVFSNSFDDFRKRIERFRIKSEQEQK